MTAPIIDFQSNDNGHAPERLPAACLDKLCQTAVAGRRAVRAMSRHLQRFGLGEPDVQVLWILGQAAETGVDQTTIASRLTYSAAQISATVEKLRRRGLLLHRAAPGDRRRRIWVLAVDGRSLVREMAQLVAGADHPDLPREAAA